MPNPADASFTHLEVHSHFTLLGGTASVTELAGRAAADGMTRLALTDTNALYGAVAFARACRAVGVQPIIGMTVTVAEALPSRPPPSPQDWGAGGAWGAVVLLATGPAGYRSLCRLSSLIQGRPDREAAAEHGLGWDELREYREGLICLSGGRQGWIERYLRGGDPAAARLYAARLAGIFGEDAYLSFGFADVILSGSERQGSLHGQESEESSIARQRFPIWARSAGRVGSESRIETKRAALERRLGLDTLRYSTSDAPYLELLIAREVVALGRRLGLPTVAVQPVYCLAPEDAPRLQLLEAIRRNCLLSDLPGENATGPEGFLKTLRVWPHWLSPDEVAARFADFPEAFAMAGQVAARCGPALPDGRPIWPALKLPPAQTPDAALAAQAEAGLAEKYGPAPAPAVRDRLAAELAAIARHGYAPLFLVVADIVRFARRQEIPVSTRGSVANSLVAYCVGITTVDPIAHDLLFERFLNPARADPPDIDLDLCSRRRDEVLDYVRRTYGPEHVALVGTVSTMRLQSAVRETAKAHGLAEEELNRLLPLLPHDWHPDPRRRDRRTVADVLAELADPRLRAVLQEAAGLVGQPDHLSVHPGGVVITPGPLTDYVPVQWAPKGFLITQFEHEDVAALGLPKIDLLGVRALTVLADAAELVRRASLPPNIGGATIPPGLSQILAGGGGQGGHLLDAIPLDDPLTGDLLERGETIGVFQCESDGAQRTLRKLRARTVRDLAIANAFFKPGPSTGGMANAFVRRYRGEEPVTFLHPALAPILGPTKGVLIFQEQILRVATEIAGLSWAQADHLRRGMSKFRAEEMAELREQFIAGCQRPAPEGPGFTSAQAQKLWEQVLAFAGYGFNQGHATAYADVSYRSAYLKAHWPAEFLCARLADFGGFHHPAVYMAEAIRLGIAVRPPHVNYSEGQFTLLRISDCGFRIDHHPFDTADKSAIRNPQSAIVFMGLGQVRDLRQSAIRAIVAERERGGPYSGLRDLLARVELRPKETDHLIRCGALDGLAACRAALLAEARGIRRTGDAQQMAFAFAEPEVPAETLAQRWAWEQEVLGLPVSALADPLVLVADRLPEHTPLSKLPELPGRPVTVAGVRLPGWTGGEGFFLSDGPTFVIAKGAKGTKAPPPWQPLLLRGRWLGDQWGTFWFQVEVMEEK